MKRVLVTMCLLLSNAPVYGELVPVEKIEIAQSTVFADLSSLHRQGSHVKMWAVFDYEGGRRMESIGGFVASSKNLYEYDCTEKRERVLATMLLSGHMGSGEIVHQMTGNLSWQPVPPEGPEHTLWMAACTRQAGALDVP